MTPEYGLGLPVFVLNFFEQMFSRLAKPTVLVFDNFQDFPVSSPLHELLPQVANMLPDDVTIIFISRTDVYEDFVSLRVSRSLVQIPAEAMLLDNNEARQISSRVIGESVADGEVAQLNKQSGGWLAGLLLLLEGAGEVTGGKEINTSVFDYFAAEVMRRADEETQDFLAKCSLLSVMDAGTAAILTGNARAEVILKNLARRNYFISRLPGDVMRYEFHPLFHDYLQEELHRRFNDDDVRQLRHRAGLILTGQEEYAGAVELLSAAGATEELVQLVLNRAEKMIAEGRYQTLARWLEAIPEPVHRQQPWLLYWRGVSLFPFEPHNASNYFEQAYAKFESANDVAGMYLSWAGIAESCTLQWDDFSHMSGWLEKFYTLNQTHPEYPSAEIEVQVQQALFSVLAHMGSDRREFWQAKEMAERLLVDSSFNTELRIKNGTNLAIFYSWAGQFAEMRRVVETLEMLAKQENISPLSQILIKANHGTLCWITGEPEEASNIIQAAIDIARKSGVHILDSYNYAQLVYAKGIMQDLNGMRQSLAVMKGNLIEHRRVDVAHYLFLMSWYKSLTREYTESLEYARQSIAILKNLSVQMPLSLGSLALARALIEQGDYDAAETMIDRALEFITKTPGRHLEWVGRMQEAYMRLRQGRMEDAVKAVSAAFGIPSSEVEFWTFPHWDVEMVSELCALALKHGIEQDYVNSLIKQWRLLPPQGVLMGELWPWHIRVYTLGSFSLLVDDKPVKLSGKTLELLNAIIALGGRDISTQRLSDLLWRDAEGDQANSNFKTTLHRLRKLIGQDAFALQDGRLSIDTRLVWVDAWALERTLDTLDSASDEELDSLVQKVISQYRGGFLPGEGASWMLSVRERLRSRFLRVIDMAAARLEKLGRSREAIHCYQSALDVDPLAERLYTGLMRCHFHNGETAEGLAAYNRCHQVLAAELGVAPSTETEKWHTKLRQPSS